MAYHIHLLTKLIQQGHIIMTEHFSIGPYPNGAGYALFSKNSLVMESSNAQLLAAQFCEYYDISKVELFFAMHKKVMEFWVREPVEVEGTALPIPAYRCGDELE